MDVDGRVVARVQVADIAQHEWPALGRDVGSLAILHEQSAFDAGQMVETVGAIQRVVNVSLNPEIRVCRNVTDATGLVGQVEIGAGCDQYGVVVYDRSNVGNVARASEIKDSVVG